jgi:hypothetical protein
MLVKKGSRHMAGAFFMVVFCDYCSKHKHEKAMALISHSLFLYFLPALIGEWLRVDVCV